MAELLDRCLAATGRDYPEGYGFALGYCDNAGNVPYLLLPAALACMAYSYGKAGHKAGWSRSGDVARFAAALASLPPLGAHWGRDVWQPGLWLVEGVQLVLTFALHGPVKLKAQCAAALKAAGHVGYD